MEILLSLLIAVTLVFSVVSAVLIGLFWERFVVFLLKRFMWGALAFYLLMAAFIVFFFTEALEKFFDVAPLEMVFNGVSVVLLLCSEVTLLSVLWRGRVAS